MSTKASSLRSVVNEGFEDRSEVVSVEATFVLDATLPPGVVVVSPALAIQLGAGGRGRAWLDVAEGPVSERDPVRRGSSDVSPDGLQVAPVGHVWRGSELIRGGDADVVYFLAADEGTSTAAAREPIGSGGAFRQLVELSWVLPAEPGDGLIDGEGRVLRVMGYGDASSSELRTTLPRVLRHVVMHPSTPISSLELSAEAKTALREIGLTTLGELAATSDAQLLSTKRVDRRMQKELAACLASTSCCRSVLHLDADGPRVLRCSQSLASPFRLLLPRARRELRARSVGPYDPLLQRPIASAPQVTRRQLAALLGAGARALAEEVVWRSDDADGHLALYEDFISGVDPRTGPSSTSRNRSKFASPSSEAPSRVGWTPSVEYLDALLSVLGFGLELQPEGFRLRFTLLGGSLPDAAVPTEPLPHGTRRGSTTAAWSFGEVGRPDLLGRSPLRRDQCSSLRREAAMRHFGHITLAAPVLPLHLAELAAERLGVPAERLVEASHEDLAASLAARLGASGLEEGAPALESLLYRVVPVLPMGLRSTPGSTLDLTVLYERLLDANEVLHAKRESGAPTGQVARAHRELQGALDALLGNVSGPPLGSDDTPLLGVCAWLGLALPEVKGVDYAAETVVVVDPALAPGRVSLGMEVLRELLKPRAAGQLCDLRQARTLDEAIERLRHDDPEARAVLTSLATGQAVWLAHDDRVTGARIAAVDDGAGLRVSGATAAALNATSGGRCTLHWPMSGAGAAEAARLGAPTLEPERRGWMDLLAQGASAMPRDLLNVARRGELDGHSAAARSLWLR